MLQAVRPRAHGHVKMLRQKEEEEKEAAAAAAAKKEHAHGEVSVWRILKLLSLRLRARLREQLLRPFPTHHCRRSLPPSRPPLDTSQLLLPTASRA